MSRESGAAHSAPHGPPAGDRSLGGLSIVAFTEALAARTPVPGGGAAGALALAQAAALATMVVEYTISKPAFVEHAAALERHCSELTAERVRAVALVDADADAYRVLNDALARPKVDAARPELVRGAARAAAAPPAEVLDRAANLLARIGELVDRTTPMLRSDLGVAGALALAAAEAGAWNVRANMPLVGDEREPLERKSGAALARAREAKHRLDAALEIAAARARG